MMKRKGLSYKKVANHLKCSKTAVWYWFNLPNANPNVSVLVDLCNVLDLEPETFFVIAEVQLKLL